MDTSTTCLFCDIDTGRIIAENKLACVVHDGLPASLEFAGKKSFEFIVHSADHGTGCVKTQNHAIIST